MSQATKQPGADLAPALAELRWQAALRVRRLNGLGVAAAFVAAVLWSAWIAEVDFARLLPSRLPGGLR